MLPPRFSVSGLYRLHPNLTVSGRRFYCHDKLSVFLHTPADYRQGMCQHFLCRFLLKCRDGFFYFFVSTQSGIDCFVLFFIFMICLIFLFSSVPSGYSQSTNAYIKSDRRLNPATDTNLLLAVYGGGSHLTFDIFCLQFLHFQTSDFEVI